MVQKYFFILIMLVSTMVISCRQTEELSTTEDMQTKQTKVLDKTTAKGGGEEPEIYEPKLTTDSTSIEVIDPNDPPKSGTHWKTKK